MGYYFTGPSPLHTVVGVIARASIAQKQQQRTTRATERSRTASLQLPDVTTISDRVAIGRPTVAVLSAWQNNATAHLLLLTADLHDDYFRRCHGCGTAIVM